MREQTSSEKSTVPVESNQIFDQSPSSRKSSIQLTEDEIILAYHKLQMEKAPAAEVKEDVIMKRNDIAGNRNDENYLEFLKWMEMKRNNEKLAAAAALSTIIENVSLPRASNHTDEKVKTNNGDINVITSCLDEEKSLVGHDESFKHNSVNVSCCGNENDEKSDEIAARTEIVQSKIQSTEIAPNNEAKADNQIIRSKNQSNTATHNPEDVDLLTLDDSNFKSFDDDNSVVESLPNDENKKSKDLLVDDITANAENEKKTESDQDMDFEEFKDAISEDDGDYLKVPLIIREENDKSEDLKAKECEGVKCQDNNELSTVAATNEAVTEINNDAIIPTTIIDDENVTTCADTTQGNRSNTVDAKLTLTNDPLQIVTHLSSSSVSLASSLDPSENKIKRPARHSKGRAPQPPAASSAATNVIDGYFYDELTKKHFKETEL